MRILLIGAGGVGSAAVAIAARRDFFDALVIADFDPARAQRAVDAVVATGGADPRLSAAQVDASDPGAVEALARVHGVDTRAQRGGSPLRDADLRRRFRCWRRLSGSRDVAVPSASRAPA